MRIAPSPLGFGSARITLEATDEDGLEDTASFRLDVTAPFQTRYPKITAGDAADNDRFGHAVAIDGDYAIVGAIGADLTGFAEGAAYVFERAGDTWTQVDELTANDAADDDTFGYSVAIDGEFAIVGAYLDDVTGTNEGSAYVFVK